MTGPSGVRAGDRYQWNSLSILVTRVSRKGEWADIKVTPPYLGAPWTKRQPLPFPSNFVLIERAS